MESHQRLGLAFSDLGLYDGPEGHSLLYLCLLQLRLYLYIYESFWLWSFIPEPSLADNLLPMGVALAIPCIKQNYEYTVETGLLAHDALLGSIAELYTLIFENAPVIPSPTQKPDVSVMRADSQAG